MRAQGDETNELEFLLNRHKPANMAKLPADIQYLLDDKIGLVLSEGLNVLYNVQPRHPIDYFSKWLLNYEATQKNKKTVHESDNKTKDVLKKYDEVAEVRKKREAEAEGQRQMTEKAENTFNEKLQNHEYHEELLTNDLPSFIEKQKGLPAVYIGKLEHPTRAVADDEEEELAHLDTSQQKLISYIGASGTQKFVIGRELLPETGVTYTVFQPKEEEQPPAEGEEGVPVVVKPNYLYIPDVTKDQRIVYFRIPKLGAYQACPLSYKSVLSERAFEEGVKERLRVQEERENQKRDKEQRDEEFQKRIQEAQDQEQPVEEIEEEWKNIEWPEIEEKEFEYDDRKFVLCVDTLGEDRELTEAERNYVSDLATNFVKCWEESERRQLSRDIDLYIEAQRTVNKEEFVENIASKLNEDINTQYQEDEADSEAKQNYKKAAIAAEFYKNKLLEEDVKKLIKSLADYRVIKFKPLIQNVMYFLGYKKGQVNIPGTNVLEWKEVKKIISRDEFFDKLENYEFKGPKEGYWERYALTNKLVQKLEKINIEELEDYNLGLAVLYRYVKQVVEARILDIQVRRANKEEQRRTRENNIQEAENLAAQRERELEEAQQKAAADEEEFNQEEWETRWTEEHPPIVIPDEVIDDIDEDIEDENAA
jgi:hypothetical protein